MDQDPVPVSKPVWNPSGEITLSQIATLTNLISHGLNNSGLPSSFSGLVITKCGQEMADLFVSDFRVRVLEMMASSGNCGSSTNGASPTKPMTD